MQDGRYNIATGFFGLLAFAALGFLLIYLRDVVPDPAAWIADLSGKHFEVTLAHVHGNLFSLTNIAIGLVLARSHAIPACALGSHASPSWACSCPSAS